MTTEATVLPREVNIFFAGLFFFTFANPQADDKYAEGHVGIFKSQIGKTPIEHDLCLKLVDDSGDERDYKIYHTTLGSLEKEIAIEKKIGEATQASEVSLLEGWTRPDESRLDEPDPLPFGWILDFESNDLHGPTSRVDKSQLHTVLRV
jgi:hypothetical protein